MRPPRSNNKWQEMSTEEPGTQLPLIFVVTISEWALSNMFSLGFRI